MTFLRFNNLPSVEELWIQKFIVVHSGIRSPYPPTPDIARLSKIHVQFTSSMTLDILPNLGEAIADGLGVSLQYPDPNYSPSQANNPYTRGAVLSDYWDSLSFNFNRDDLC